MAERLITLCYRKIIEAGTPRAWDKLVLEDTYQELRLQAQTFDHAGRYRTYAELLHHVPAAAQLPFLVSAVVRGYLPQLGGMLPDVADNLGRRVLPFSRFQFEIINSDLRDPSRHQVAINFYTDTLRWHDTVGTWLLVSVAAAGPGAEGEVLTHLVPVQPYLSVYSLQQPATT